MANFNRVFLMGNLTRDPELRYIPSGTAVCDLRLAINRKFKDQSGQLRDEVCYVTAVVWGRQAESCNQYLSKGSGVFVEGRLQYRSWESPNGQKRNALDVRAERVQFVGGRRTEGAPRQGKEPLSADTFPSQDNLPVGEQSENTESTHSEDVPF